MFCPNCGTQNPETASTCTKCGFALKSAAPKFKGTMLMQGAPPNMQAIRDATAGSGAPPPPAAGPVSAVGVGAPSAGAGNSPPSRLKGTIVGVAAPAAGAAPAPPTATGAGAPPGPGFPGTLAFDAPPPGQFGAPDPVPMSDQQHQFGSSAAANPLGATFALGADGSPPLSPFGNSDLGGAPNNGGFGAPPADQPFGAAPQGGFGGPPPGGDPNMGGYGAPPADPNMGGYGAPPAADPNMGGYGAPPGGANPYGQQVQPDYGQQQQQQQPAGGYGQQPMGQMGGPMGGAPMQPYGGGQMMGGPMGQMGMAAGPGGPPKSWMVTLILACVAGTLGVHRFYTGHMLFGALQLVTCGGGGIWTLIDIVFILTGKYTDAQGRPLQR